MFIPKRINVGFKDKEVANQVRLSYVIYWDEKRRFAQRAVME